MERYFIVTEQSKLRKDWFAYKENREKVIELYKQYTVQAEIESREYYVSDDEIYIIPTEKDSTKFLPFLCNPINDGLCKFKASSKIAKGWIKALKDADLKVQQKPMVILYFKSFGGKYRSRVFDHNDVVYCSIDPYEGESPEGFIEIKASEFFKIVEETN